MKINGRVIKDPYVEIIPIPRPDGDIIIKAKAILDTEKFNKLCPFPQPPKVLKVGMGKTPVADLKDEKYLASLDSYAALKTAWTIIESISATDGLTWDLVNPDDPNTWHLWQKELSEAGFSEAEKIRIMTGVTIAQGLNEEKVEEARQRFLQQNTQETLEK